MARFNGVIGFAESGRTNGVWEETIVEKKYKGYILQQTRKAQSNEHILDDLILNIKISIVADAYANNNLFAIRYIKWKGVSWKVTSVEPERPRLICTIGGVYNGPEPEPEQSESENGVTDNPGNDNGE